MKHILLIAGLMLTLVTCNKGYNNVEQANGVIEIPSPIITANEPAESKFIIAIDPGHQERGNFELEPIGPGASQSKAKVAAGTRGVSTKVPEYKLTLEVSLKLRDELLARGYNVFMIRETDDVNISNRERAVMATEAGADVFVRIHADGSGDSNVNGILTICPTSRNPYIPQLYTQSRALSEDILNAMIDATSAKKRGVLEVDNMSGINWSTIPVTIVEMGLMTNPTEDQLMQTEEYQRKLVIGIADGIEQYFIRRKKL
jgi:N-acetylmuramoyl-L-alanine amidase